MNSNTLTPRPQTRTPLTLTKHGAVPTARSHPPRGQITPGPFKYTPLPWWEVSNETPSKQCLSFVALIAAPRRCHMRVKFRPSFLALLCSWVPTSFRGTILRGGRWGRVNQKI